MSPTVIMLPKTMACVGFALLLVMLLAHSTTADISTTNYVVNSYTLTLTIPETTTTGSLLTGKAVIDLTCKNNSASIVLNWGSSLLPFSPNTSDISVAVATTSTDATNVPISISHDTEAQTVTLTPTLAIPSDKTVAVTINYQATVNAEANGIFMMSFPDGNLTRLFLATNAWPISARDMLPCVDQPDIAVAWSMTLTRPTTWDLVTSLSTTSSDASVTAGMTVDVLSGTSLPSSSLSIFLSGGVFNKTASTTNTAFNFWSRNGLKGTSDLNNTISTLTQLFTSVDKVISNNLTSLDVVLVPNLPQPISAPGIIYIREDSYNVSSAGQVQHVLMPVLSHYIKQYTLFRVRPASWEDYWISETINGFLEYTVLANMFPNLDLATELKVAVRQSALAMDSYSSSSPLVDTSINIDSPAAIQSSLTDPLKKLKGTAVFNMLDMSLPAGSVLTVITTLLNSYKGQAIATSNVLNSTVLLVLLNSSKINLTNQQQEIVTGVATWFNKAGYPLLTPSVSSYGAPANVSLKLIGYCDLSNCTNSVSEYVVPATIGSKSDTRYLTPRQNLVVLTGNDTSVNLTVNSGDWIASNMQSTGYYRVNYTADNWQLIRNAIASNYTEIPGISQILDDSMALALAGHLSFSESLQLVTANLKYPLFENWYPVYTNLWKLRARLWNTTAYSSFENFARMVLQDSAAVLQGGSLSETEKERILALVFDGLCEFNIADYRTVAIKNINSLLQGNSITTIGSSSYDALVCCGAQHSSSLNVSSLRSAITNSTASFYVRHYNAIALGCLANYSLISEQISSLISGTNGTSQTRALTTSAAQTKPYIATVYQSIVETHPLEFVDSLASSVNILQNLLGAPQVASLIVKVGEKINNETYASKLTSIATNSSVDATIVKAIHQTTSEVALKVNWLQQNSASLVSALKNNTVVSAGVVLKTLFTLSCLLPVSMLMFKVILA